MNTTDWLARLVAIDTTSRRSNLGLIETVRDALAAQGLSPWLAASGDGAKANLFCTVPDAGGGLQGGICLSGHTDVVPVDGQHWQSDPFRLDDRGEGRLYARGACDMKGFIASALALLPRVVAAPGARPLHLALSYDEEVGCAGAPGMLAEVQARGIRIDGCVVGEPTSMKPVLAHKGINLYRCRVHGRAAHSSLTPQGCNAIEYAARLICHIRELADASRAEGPFDELFDVPFTTFTTNLIQGGNAVNTIPAACEFVYEFRNLPQLSAQALQERVSGYVAAELLPRMRRELPEARIDIEAVASAPGLQAAEQAAITQLVRALTQDSAVRKVAYGTEAGLFARIGIPTVVCGPGSIEQAHKADEYVEAAQLAECDRFLAQLAAAP